MLAGHQCLELSPKQEKALIAKPASHKKVKGLDAVVIRSVVCLCLGCLKLLTRGPDRPIMPLGPGGPLIASCGAETAELSTLTAFLAEKLYFVSLGEGDGSPRTERQKQKSSLKISKKHQ